MDDRLRAEYSNLNTEEDFAPELHRSQAGDDTSPAQVDGMNADAEVPATSGVATMSAIADADDTILAEEARMPTLEGRTRPLLSHSADRDDLGRVVAPGQSSIGGVDAAPTGDKDRPDSMDRSDAAPRKDWRASMSRVGLCVLVLVFIGLCIRYLPRRVSRWFPPPTGACGGPQRCRVCTLRPTLPLWRWMCDECSLGYRLSNKTCEANQCTCDGGSPAIQANCTENGAEKCSECASGYHLLNHRCFRNHCFCDEGFTSHRCDEDGMESCIDCNDGFHLAGWSCKLNRCFCRSGVGINGTGCDKHGTEECSKCNGGLHLVEKACVKNLCHCRDGVAAMGAECKEDGAEQCIDCYPGFHLGDTSSVCIANRCTCRHGLPTIDKSCTLDGAEECASCDAGFHLVTGLCAENHCFCRGGTPVKGVTCDQNKAWKCSTCRDGFHMLDAHCDPYVRMYAMKLPQHTGMPALHSDLTRRNHTVVLLRGEVHWNSSAAAVLLLPELFHHLALEDAQRRALDSWVHGGGHLISCGDWFGHNGRFLNFAFDWRLQGTLASNRPRRSKPCSIFCKGPDVLEWSSSLSCFAANSLPSGAMAVYGSNNSVCAFTTSRGEGRVTYLGFNWYNASGASGSHREARAGWTDVLGLAMLGTGLHGLHD